MQTPDISQSSIQAQILPHSSTLVSLIDGINLSNWNDYYDNQTEILFKKRIDKWNLKFFWETEKCLNTQFKEEVEKIHNKLFLILFKQISLYIEEIERLNKLLLEYKPKNGDESQSSTIIKNWKRQLQINERKLKEKTLNDESKEREIWALKKELSAYKNWKELENVNINNNKKNYNNNIISSNKYKHMRHSSQSPFSNWIQPNKISSIKEVQRQGKGNRKINKSIDCVINRSVDSVDIKDLISFYNEEYEDLCSWEEILLQASCSKESPKKKSQKAKGMSSIKIDL